MNWPSSVIVRGIQIELPKHIVIRLASVVLPLPGAPIEEQSRAAVHRRAEHVEHVGLDRDIGKRLQQCRFCGASARIVWASTETM